jgi:DNA invertase Pin-like site-specific DNA recombinase
MVSFPSALVDMQLDALRKAGCTDANIFTDKITGTKQERPGLSKALSHLRPGDTFVVWRLDRLASRQIAFRSITENIDTSSATGQLVFHIFGPLA